MGCLQTTRGNGCGSTGDEQDVEDVGADNIADGKVSMPLAGGTDGSDELGQGGAEGDEGGSDDTLGNTGPHSDDFDCWDKHPGRADDNDDREEKLDECSGVRSLAFDVYLGKRIRVATRPGNCLPNVKSQQAEEDKPANPWQSSPVRKYSAGFGKWKCGCNEQQPGEQLKPPLSIDNLAIQLQRRNQAGDAEDHPGIANDRADGISEGDIG